MQSNTLPATAPACAVIRVPLSNSAETFELFADDLDRLRAVGITGVFFLTHNRGPTSARRRAYVSAKPQGFSAAGHYCAARYLADAGRGQAVRYRDGNPLNLRRHNLRIVASGAAKRRPVTADA